jgi:DNA polymerase-3 subunit gamma/tau
MRDSLSLLDRLLSIGEKTLTIETIEQLLGLPRTQLIFDIVQAMGEARTSDVLTAADRMISEGLSPDSLLASLIDHLRNLLIVRTCGVESNLVEVASISAQDLAKQAQRFDPVVLTQDIAILEDLRRQIRQSQAGRALLDATLVRLALADQFSSIADLLGHVDGQPTSPGGLPGQKKKPEPVEARGPVAPIAPAAGLSAPVMRDIPAAAPTIAPVPAGPMSLDLDEDDDLPRPGKVWDDSGPSLSEMLKQQTATAVAPPPPAASACEEPNIAAVDITNFPVIWRNLLAELKDNVGVHPLLLNGQLVRIEDGQAVIRYAPEHDQFPKMLNRNGKRELVGETLSRVIGKAVGVRFDVDASAAPPPPVAVAAPEPAPSRPAARSRPAPEPVMAAAPAPPPARLTPEQMAEFEADPLIKAVMQELDATMVRISDDV